MERCRGASESAEMDAVVDDSVGRMVSARREGVIISSYLRR